MAQYTENYNLKKPETTDNVNIADLNGNADIIDEELSDLESRLGSKVDSATTINEKPLTNDIVIDLNDISKKNGTISSGNSVTFGDGLNTRYLFISGCASNNGKQLAILHVTSSGAFSHKDVFSDGAVAFTADSQGNITVTNNASTMLFYNVLKID